MQKYFHDVKNFVESRYPQYDGTIIGDLYPPPQYAVWFGTICGYLWIIGIILIFAGSQVFKFLGRPEPSWLLWINNNRIQAFMTLFLLNNIASSFLATGAFEIYIDGNLAFSKLASKRFPSPQDLSNILSQYGY